MGIDLINEVALVTGAASGIGLANVRALAADGATVAAVDRDRHGLERVLDEAKRSNWSVTSHAADLANVDSISAVVARVVQLHGRVDMLVNNAGVSGVAGETQQITEFSMATFDTVMAINLRAPFLLTREVGQHMVERGEGGRIVNVSSSAAFQGLLTPAIYAASKSGLNALTRVSAAELAPHGINVNAVAPGVTRTPIVGQGLSDADLDSLVSAGPLENFSHRAAEPEHVAAVIRFLCLEESLQINGQIIHTSGGAIV